MRLGNLLIKSIGTKLEYPISGRIIPLLISPWIKEINGIDNVPKDGNFIISANHESYLDHLILSSIIVNFTGKKIHYLAKKEHFENFFERKWHEHTGAIPIDRQAGGVEALETAKKCLKNGKIIGVYPEGTRTLTGKLQRAKTGAARLALASNVPILPVGLVGTFKILPKGNKIPRFKRAAVNFGKPMYFDDYYGKENDKKVIRLVVTKVMKEIAKLVGQEYNFD